MAKHVAAKVRRYRLWTSQPSVLFPHTSYVNDRCSHGVVEIRCRLQVFNAGTAQEFATWEPTDRQLSRAVDGKGLVWEWQDGSYEAESKAGKPVGCLELMDEDEEA